MKLSQLSYFIAAAERGSLRAAARDLGVAQPAISRTIRELEQDLGAPLFERHQKGVILTTLGAMFLRRAHAIQSEMRHAHEEAGQINGLMTGEVSVAMTAVSSFTLFPKALTGFRQRFPDAVVKVTTAFFSEIETQLQSGQLDLYVGPLRDRVLQSKYTIEKLLDYQWVVICRKGHPLANRRSLADLAGADWVKVVLTQSPHEADIARPFLALGLPRPNVVVHASSATTTLMTVATSDLMTIVPRQLLNTPIATDKFDVLDLDEPLEAAPIYAVRRADVPLTPMAEYFCDMVRRAAVALPRRD